MRRSIALSAVGIATAFLFAASCTLTMEPESIARPSELGDFRSTYLNTFDILNGSFLPASRAFHPSAYADSGSASGTTSRATVPTLTESYELPTTVGASLSGSRANYPEPGQSSTWTVTRTNALSDTVYRIEVTTSYPETDPRERYVEAYYVRSADSTWNKDDPIVTPAGADDAGYREKNELRYRDGSVQVETIVDVTSRFAAFDIDGSLDYPDAFSPALDPSAPWSSVVAYRRVFDSAPSFYFWQGKRVSAIVGLRYYTERVEGDRLVGTTLVFEKAVTSHSTEGGSFVDTFSSLFLPGLAADPSPAFLARTVVRQRISYGYSGGAIDYDDAVRDTRSKTRVVNIPAQADSYITLINDEAAALATAPESLWVASGSEPTMLGESAVVSKTELLSTSDGLPVSAVSSSPSGDLGAFYVSLSDGVPYGLDDAMDIAGDLTGSGALSFSGAQGWMLPGSAGAYQGHERGTVQAWVRVDSPTSFAGIVHAGQRSDFSDELWSLQLWGANNTPAFGLAAQDPKYAVDEVRSSERLNTGAWYHLAGVWDLAAGRLEIYVNGVLRGSGRFSNVKASSGFATSSPIVIGSQFLDSSKSLSGYYGLAGRVNGVLIADRVYSGDELLAFYRANASKTAAW